VRVEVDVEYAEVAGIEQSDPVVISAPCSSCAMSHSKFGYAQCPWRGLDVFSRSNRTPVDVQLVQGLQAAQDVHLALREVNPYCMEPLEAQEKAKAVE
jgi:hypothetical protein